MLRYAITDRLSLGDDEATRHAALLQQATRLAAESVQFLQLREKDLPAGALSALARQMFSTLREHAPATKLLIHSRADIALALRADGVHLPATAGTLTPTQVRQLYAAARLPEPVVSVSCHTLAEVLAARAAAASLILFGPIFGKEIRGEAVVPAVGLSALQSACAAAAPVPVLALGGITHANTAACLAAGAAGIAAIRLFARATPVDAPLPVQ